MSRSLRLLLLLVAWTTLGRTVAWAQCNPAGTTVTLDYSTRTTGESWINKANTSVPATSSFTQVNTNAVPYTSSDNNSTLAVGAFNGVTTLVWSVTEPNSTTANSVVTYTFSRPVSNFSVRVQDIDASFTAAGVLNGVLAPSHGWTDQVTFTGANAGTAVTPTLTKANTTSTFVVTAGNVATGQPAAGNTTSPVDATVTASFPSPITSLTLTYRNITTATNLDQQIVGIDQLTWCRITPTASNVTTATVPSTATQTSISSLVGTADGTPSYVITSLPANGTGTLYYNSTGTTYAAVVAGQALTLAQAASLRYAPNAGYTGTSTTFGYQTADDANLTSTTATYTIPLQYVAPCATAAATLDFSTRTANEDWKAHAAISVPATSTLTTVGSGNYTTSPASTSTLQIGTVNNATTLAWTNQYTSTTPGNGTTPGAGRTSSVTFTFNRPVANFTVQVQDIDVNNAAGSVFIDQVVFSGSNGGTAVTPTLTAMNPNAGSVTTNGNTATGRNYNAQNGVDGTVTAYFPSPITTLTLTYNNTSPGTNINTNQAVGIDNMTWCRLAPTANPVTTTTVPSTAIQAGIAGLSGTADGTVASYTVTSLPANGTLYYNSTGTTYAAVTAGQSLTLAQAASLRYTPNAGYAGTSTTFGYTATDDAGVVSGNTATYTVPLTNTACATATGTLDFSKTTPVPDDWRAHAALPVPAGSSFTSLSSGNYVTPTTATTSTLMTVAANAAGNLNGVQTLLWYTDYANTTDNTSSVTFTFTRPVSNFAVRVQDIDRFDDGTNAFTDQVTFVGANGTTAVTPVLGPLNPNNANSVLINGNVATGTVNNTNTTDATVIAYFASPITSLTLTYRNLETTQTNPAANAIGIDLLSFCRLAPVATNITNSSRPGGQGATSVNALSATADGTVASYTIASLDATQGTYYVNGVVLNTTNFPGLVLTAAQASQLSFAPAGSFSGTAGFNYTATDDAGLVSNVATYSVPVTATGASGTPAPCATAGKDGSPTISANPNTYYPATASAAAGATSLTVGAGTLGSTAAANTITAGDLLLVIQMQGADINSTNTDSYGDGVAGGGASGNLTTNFQAGTYEYVVATNTTTVTAGGNITLASGLVNSYVSSAASTTAGPRRFQVVRIPQYLNLTLGGTLTATPWNGSIGGIIALDVAGQTSFNGNTIDASARGFRGGGGRVQTINDYRSLDYVNATNTSDQNAQKGEGTAGTPRFVNMPTTPNDASTNVTSDLTTVGYPGGTAGRGAPGNAGGGANDDNNNSGGGGGANGANGGRGGNSFADNYAIGGEPGASFNSVSSSRIVLGGGGGAGTNDTNTGTPTNGAASSGAAGGGIVLLRTGTLTGTGTISANGGSANSSLADDGGGGGGAGGSILVTAANAAGLANLALQANGGTGGTNTGSANGNGPHGPGGGGGGGVILANGNSASASVLAGANGTTRNANALIAYGSSAGMGGVSNSSISTSIANSAAGANCVADVATTITAPTNPVAAGQTATLNVAFINNGPLTAANVTRQVQLPAGLTNVVATNGGTYNATTGLVTYLNVGSLAPGDNSASSVITFTAPASGSVAVTSTIGTASPEVVTTNNTSTFSLGLAPVADVTTTLAGPVALNAGQPSGTFTATYSNYGPSAASTVTQQVTIPAGATNVLVNGVAYTPTNNVIDFGTAGTLASGATNTFTYSFTAPTTTGAVTQKSNVTTATSEGTGTGTYADAATFNSTIGTTTDVSTTIAAANASVATGQTGTFNVTFANAGPNSATSPTLQVQLPAGLSGVTITGTSSGTTGSYNAATGIVTYTYGTAGTALPSGTNITSAINFTVPPTGSVTAAAAISTTTNELGRTANNAASATIAATPGADVATVISGPSSTVAGTMTTYSVLTTNNGPSPATTVAQTVTIPTGLTGVFISNGGTYNSSTGVVTFPSLGALVSGGVVNNTISFLAPSSTITATANVSTATTDPVTTNNTSTATTSVTTPAATNPLANVYTTITTPSNDVAPGTALAFTVVAGNAGPNPAAVVVERVSLPTGLTGVTITDANGNAVTGASYSSTTGIVTFPQVDLLASGSANTYVVTVNAPASGLISATASIAATTNDQIAADNVATTDVTVNAPGDVATALTGPTAVGAGQAVTYTVTTTNNGLVPAANVVQTVTIPAGLTSVTLSGSGKYDATTGLVTFPAIASQAAGSSVVNTIMYTAPAAPTLVNVAMVTTSSPDNVATNNRSAVTTAVNPISDVTVAISGPTSIVQGNQIDYTVTTTNNGPSTATNVATRVQLPPGLGTIILSNSATGALYNNTTGVVTFPTIANQAPGSDGTVTNIIRFAAPSNLSQVNATATVSEAGTAQESNYANNTASITTTETAPTTIQTDLSTIISASPNPPTAGQAVTFTVTTTNATSSTGTATGVVQRVALEAGLTISSISNGGTYDPVTGVVTFPAISLTAGTTQTNTIVVVAPGSTPLQVRALVTGNQSDPTLTNNSSFLNLTVTPRADIATFVSGPTTVATGDAVTYSVLTLNNGPSPAASVAQTVTIPSGLTGVTISGGGTYDSNSGIVTFPTIAAQQAGAAGQVMNTISFTAPSNTYSVVGNVSTTTTEPTAPGTANNTSTVNVAPGNLAPVANAVVNTLQTPEGNTAGPLLLSPLSATDANGNNTIASYTLTSIPDATTQGVLSLNGTALTVNSPPISAADAANLRFDPVAGFVGNAFFGYTATDNSGSVSAASALYTIPVGQDVNSFYTPYNQNKGGANPYQLGDVLAAVIDNNGARYTSAGTIYSSTGALLAGAANGLALNSAAQNPNARLATTGPASNPTNALPSGVDIDANTGRIFVKNPSQLPNLTQATTYQVNVTTIDVDGGVSTVLATFTLGAYPLPVELVAFTAQAVQNRDTQLGWTTASELNNDHFDVERSLDGITFAKVGAVAGQGTKASATTYAFTDAGIGPKVAAGLPVYYRLRQVDATGTSSYSPVRTVTFGPAAAAAVLTLYPNPAVSTTALDLSALPATATYQVVLLDAVGRQVRQATLSGGLAQTLNVADLASGTYQVVVSGTQADGSALRKVLRLTKE